MGIENIVSQDKIIIPDYFLKELESSDSQEEKFLGNFYTQNLAKYLTVESQRDELDENLHFSNAFYKDLPIVDTDDERKNVLEQHQALYSSLIYPRSLLNLKTSNMIGKIENYDQDGNFDHTYGVCPEYESKVFSTLEKKSSKYRNGYVLVLNNKKTNESYSIGFIKDIGERSFTSWQNITNTDDHINLVLGGIYQPSSELIINTKIAEEPQNGKWGVLTYDSYDFKFLRMSGAYPNKNPLQLADLYSMLLYERDEFNKK